ncbi:unnamed protein product [Prorocentrum cordatum]|uniref:Transmembrane protein 107 n=1 Tax=Prorocentrum cordatum TaxID=2364126 RepID=A0ABN9TJK5_9DINO|nr:unnamed protein product [Polarella glacialis]
MFTVGAITFITSVAYFLVANVEVASDTEWFSYGMGATFFNAGQIVSSLWGFWIVWQARSDDQCQHLAEVALWYTVICAFMFLFITVVSFLVLKLVFLPSFAIQVLSLQDFK